MEEVFIKIWGVTICVIIFFVGVIYFFQDERDNSKLNYSKSGKPANCRTLIKENIDGVKSGLISIEKAMLSIEINCNSNGILWKKKLSLKQHNENEGKDEDILSTNNPYTNLKNLDTYESIETKD